MTGFKNATKKFKNIENNRWLVNSWWIIQTKWKREAKCNNFLSRSKFSEIKIEIAEKNDWVKAKSRKLLQGTIQIICDTYDKVSHQLLFSFKLWFLSFGSKTRVWKSKTRIQKTLSFKFTIHHSKRKRSQK